MMMLEDELSYAFDWRQKCHAEQQARSATLLMIVYAALTLTP